MNSLARVRAVADAVLYEGYLLYPYRWTSAKNQARWQFGVLGPPATASAGIGEDPGLMVHCLLGPTPDSVASVRIFLRFLQLQERMVERANGLDPVEGFTPVEVLTSTDHTWLRWDEGVEHELELGSFELRAGRSYQRPVEVPGGEDVEVLRDPDGRLLGRVRRRRHPLTARLTVDVRPVAPGRPGSTPGWQMSVGVLNQTEVVRPDRTASPDRDARGRLADRDAAVWSLLGTHLILVAEGAPFVSVIDPPDWAVEAADGLRQQRSWPVLAGAPGDTDTVLASPIILYDYPEVAAESSGALFDSTEIDEILTLRVMTLTDDEKAAARATDPQAAAIIDRCDGLSPDDLQRLHGVIRNPDFPTITTPGGTTSGVTTATNSTPGVTPSTDVPWWDPAADASVEPSTDAVLVQGVEVRRGSLVILRPSRRADAQDLFLTGQQARVTAVFGDVDGNWHVAVVLVDDPAADLHESSGRYLYFGPEELEPLAPNSISPNRESREKRS